MSQEPWGYPRGMALRTPPALPLLPWLAAVLLAPVTLTGGAAPDLPIPTAAAILEKVRPGHPRLLASAAAFDSLRARSSVDSRLKEWRGTLRQRADRLLDEAPSKYEIPDGLRLLSTSRRVVDRVYTLALAYRLEGERRHADRAFRELEAAAAFPDWNPRHFLDTAEMTHAFAIGYDWLHDVWTPGQRTALERAMVTHGLTPALDIYRRNTGWSRARHNWNQVCNGGLGVGALALAGVEPALAGEVLEAALRSIQLPMREYGPDGAWAEGPGYWRYATQYNVLLLAALESALGTDFGLADIPGFAEAGQFPLHITGPLGRTFNYADGGDGAIRSPELFWLARRFGRPEYARLQARHAQPLPLDLLWCDPAQLDGPAPRPALDRHFREAEVVTFRSVWDDRDALFVGFKAGDNQANHSNLDLGTFVLDALGVRWAVDLGADNYNLPGYFGRQRWTYYRLRAEGHNTVVVNPTDGPDQDPAASARITRFVSQTDRAFATTDLSAASRLEAGAVRRGLLMLDRQAVLVQDEFRLPAPSEAWWFLHTPAEVRLQEAGRTAELTLEGRRLHARIIEPARAVFTVREAVPLPGSPKPDGQNPNRGLRKLAIHLPGVTATRLAVLLEPLAQGRRPRPSPPTVTALDAW